MATIIDFEEKYSPEFRALNMEWLETYQLLESHDVEVLDDPVGTILQHGGYIFLAMEDDQVVGTSALMNEQDGLYELAKMTVAPASRGKGISKLLIEKCLDKAKEIGAKKLLLWSNSQLQTAIHLYSSYGFKHVEVTGSPFVTADVKMELLVEQG